MTVHALLSVNQHYIDRHTKYGKCLSILLLTVYLGAEKHDSLFIKKVMTFTSYTFSFSYISVCITLITNVVNGQVSRV